MVPVRSAVVARVCPKATPVKARYMRTSAARNHDVIWNTSCRGGSGGIVTWRYMPPSVQKIRSAAVLGAGTMGAQIAAHFANAGYPVMLLDVSAHAAKQGLERA